MGIMSLYEPISAYNQEHYRQYTRCDFGPEHYHKTKIVFVGDSFTYGVGVNETETVPSYVQNWLGDEYKVYNLGKPGGSMDYALHTLIRYLNNHDMSAHTHTVVFGGTSISRRFTPCNENQLPSYNELSEKNCVNRIDYFDELHFGNFVVDNKDPKKIHLNRKRIAMLDLISPVEDYYNLEKNIKMLELLAKTHKFNVLLWNFEAMRIGTETDQQSILNVFADIDRHMTTDFVYYEKMDDIKKYAEANQIGINDLMLPCRHWSSTGNQVIASGMVDAYFNKFKRNT